MNNTAQPLTIKQMQKNAAQAETLLKQLANANRLMVLCHLVSGEKTVSELAEAVGLSQSALSQHLAKLREDNLVRTRRDAQTIYYSVSHPQVLDMITFLNQLYSRKTV